MSLKWSSSYVHSTQLWTAASFIYVGKALKVSKNISILAQKTFYSGLEKQQKITALQQRLASASLRIDVLFFNLHRLRLCPQMPTRSEAEYLGLIKSELNHQSFK